MTWRDAARVVVGTWPSQVGGWEPETLAGYLAELEARGVTPAEAVDAVRASESKWPLSAGEVLAAVRGARRELEAAQRRAAVVADLERRAALDARPPVRLLPPAEGAA